jgi:hypothetical protein
MDWDLLEVIDPDIGVILKWIWKKEEIEGTGCIHKVDDRTGIIG